MSSSEVEFADPWAEVADPFAAETPAPIVVEAPRVEVMTVLKSNSALAGKRRADELEEEIYQDAIRVTGASLKFAEVDEESSEPPEAWILEHGLEEATVRHRIARYAQMNAKAAPVGLKMAVQTLQGMARARAERDQGPRTLNMQVVQVVAPMPQFEEQLHDQD